MKVRAIGKRRLAAGAAIVAAAAAAVFSGVPAAAAETTSGASITEGTSGVDWRQVAAGDSRFVYLQAGEGTRSNPDFGVEFAKSGAAGVLRGAYFVARPDLSTGSQQAGVLLELLAEDAHPESTLPASLDLTPNSVGPECYGLGPRDLRRWIDGFADRYEAAVGTPLIVHTDTGWWNRCTDSWDEMGGRTLLSHHEPENAEAGLPAGWDFRSFHWRWEQVDVPGVPEPAYPGEFAGDEDELRGLVVGS